MAKKTTKKVAAKPKTVKKTVKKQAPTKTKTTIKTKKLTFKQKMYGLVSLAVILLGAGVWLWWSSMLMNPQRALDDMLANSLRTQGITKSISQDTASQSVRLYFQPEPMAQTSTILKQEGPNGPSSVTTETIGTRNADYVRYTDINTGGLPTPGIEEVVNVWATQGSNESLGAQPTFLNEASLAIIPFGNLSQDDAAKVLSAMDEKQLYDYDKVDTRWVKGRPTLIYSMSIKPSDLISVLKVYSEVAKIGDESQLRAEDYAGARELNIQVAVDAISRQLVNVAYPDSGRNEVYSGYGLKNLVDLPEQPISILELQTKIQNLARQQQPTQQ